MKSFFKRRKSDYWLFYQASLYHRYQVDNILTRTEKAERDSARRPEKIDSDEILHSPLIVKNITLNETNCIKTQYIDFSRKPIANEWCRIYIYQGDETFEILTKTDDNGWIYIINLPDGEYDIDIEGDA